MIDAVERARRLTIAKILAVNDLCPNEPHKKAMRAIVMAAVNEGFDAVANNKAEQRAGSRGPEYRPEKR